MRITYRTLGKLIAKMTDEQQDADVTVEMDNKCYAAELRICGETHDSLDADHPVLLVPDGEIDPRSEDVDLIWDQIS